MSIWNKQHLKNIWGSVHEKVKQHSGWVEKMRFLQKCVYVDFVCDQVLGFVLCIHSKQI